jgi:hypothetical protein
MLRVTSHARRRQANDRTPEHYLRAQELAAEAASALASGSTVTPAVLAAIGQIHATLAATSAAWREVTGQE